MLIGSHMSIAGGIYKAPARGKEVGCATIQIFTKNANQWRAKPLLDEDIVRFREALDETGIGPVMAHDSYLVNLASPDDALYAKSIDALQVEMERAEALGLPGLIIHPGAHVGSGEAAGLARIVGALDALHARTEGFGVRILLETTAGQGSNLGYRFEHLAEIMEKVSASDRLGVCYDTCHTFAAGYDIRDEKSYGKVFDEFDRVIGMDRLKAIHLNDSKGELGGRLDRHEHIGKGRIGLEGFRSIMNDEGLDLVPKLLETPKDKEMTEDRMNLETLRRLVK